MAVRVKDLVPPDAVENASVQPLEHVNESHLYCIALRDRVGEVLAPESGEGGPGRPPQLSVNGVMLIRLSLGCLPRCELRDAPFFVLLVPTPEHVDVGRGQPAILNGEIK